MRVLVVGGSGLLGRSVCRRGLGAGWSVVGTFHSGEIAVPGVAARRLDVTDRSAVRALVAEVRPDAVVGTPYRYGDWAVTADGAAHVALAAAEVGARLVHVSSDALHAGRPVPYADDEPPTPVHAYGAAKAAAETAVRAIDPGAALVRTSLIVGEGSKQIQLCRDALAGRATLFSDELRCPIDVTDLADPCWSWSPRRTPVCSTWPARTRQPCRAGAAGRRAVRPGPGRVEDHHQRGHRSGPSPGRTPGFRARRRPAAHPAARGTRTPRPLNDACTLLVHNSCAQEVCRDSVQSWRPLHPAVRSNRAGSIWTTSRSAHWPTRCG